MDVRVECNITYWVSFQCNLNWSWPLGHLTHSNKLASIKTVPLNNNDSEQRKEKQNYGRM